MSDKKRIGVIFGGRSGEHEVSLLSAASVIRAINKDKYDLAYVGITREGQWLRYEGPVNEIESGSWQKPEYTTGYEGFIHLTDMEGEVEKSTLRYIIRDHDQEKFNQKLAAKYEVIRENEVRYEEYQTEDAEYLFVAFGCSSRICEAVVDQLREEGVKAGLLRPITLFPFPTKRIKELSAQVKSMMSIELNLGQMVDDVRLAVNGACPVGFYGRQGGNIYTPDEIVEEFKKFNNLK